MLLAPRLPQTVSAALMTTAPFRMSLLLLLCGAAMLLTRSKQC